MLDKYLSWFKAHERLLLVVAVILFGVHLSGGVLNYLGRHDDAKVQALTAQVSQDEAIVRSNAKAADLANEQYQTALTQLLAQNAQLGKALQASQALLATNRKTDAGMDMPALATRINTLVPATAGGITPSTSGLALTVPASHAVADQLEAVPVLQDQLKSETQVAQNSETMRLAAGKANDALTAEVGALGKQLTDTGAQCKAEVAAEKIKTKKAFIRGLKWGFVAGFAAGAWVVHAL